MIYTKIRQSVFETNSSSMHTLSYKPSQSAATNDKSIEAHTKNNVLTIRLDEYNCEGWVLETHYEKLCYLMTMFIYSNTSLTNKDNFVDLNYDLEQYCLYIEHNNPKFEDSVYPLIDWIKNEYNFVDVVAIEPNKWFYCDHQSCCESFKELFEMHQINSIDDIMQQDCIIHIDGDH